MRLLASAVILVLPFGLAACSPSGDTPAETPPVAAEPVMLGGVDLNRPVRALGTEPFWGVEITPQALVYSGVDRAERRASNPGPLVQGTTAVYAAMIDNGAERDGPGMMVVTLIATECSDGMSDRTYPLTARVELGEETLNGCAAPTAAVTARPAP